MKKQLLLLLLAPLLMVAQQPFGENATWYFDYTQSLTRGFKKVTHVSDTVIQNVSWQKFAVTGLTENKYGSGPQDIVQDTNVSYPSVFLSTRNDSVFYFNTQGEVKLLFDFNAKIGDQWVFANSISQFGCNNVPRATVMNIGFDTINGQAVKYWEVENPMDTFIILNQPVYMCASGYCMPTKIYKDIGCAWYSFLFAPSPNACNGQPINLEYHQIRCYSDNNISVNFTNKACNYWSLIGIDEYQKNQLTVYPNPTSKYINLESVQEVEVVTVYDLSGRLLLETTNTSPIEMPQINGLYLLSIVFKNGTVVTQKVEVQGF